MNITLIVTVIEIISLAVKAFIPKLTKWLPLVNSILGVGMSLILGVDVLTGLATAGVSCMSYDFFHNFYKMIKSEDNKEIEQK